VGREFAIELRPRHFRHLVVIGLCLAFGPSGGVTPIDLAASIAFWLAAERSSINVWPNFLTLSFWPFCCASLPISTSAKLPSIAFFRNAWLGFSAA
jgi:hypothetical protein